MKTLTIVTPSNIEVEYRLAGAGSRLAAFLIDFAVQSLLILTVLLVVIFGIDRGIFGNETPSGTALGVVMVFGFLVQFFYFVVLEMMTNGQSLGKRVFGLRVLRDNGMPLEFPQSLVRGLLRASLDLMYVGVFVMLFSKKYKRIGDMAAGTVVVLEKFGTRHDPALLREPPQWPEYLPDRYRLTAEEIAIAEEWLARRGTMTDGGASSGDAIVLYLQGKYPPVQVEVGAIEQTEDVVKVEESTQVMLRNLDEEQEIVV